MINEMEIKKQTFSNLIKKTEWKKNKIFWRFEFKWQIKN